MKKLNIILLFFCVNLISCQHKDENTESPRVVSEYVETIVNVKKSDLPEHHLNNNYSEELTTEWLKDLFIEIREGRKEIYKSTWFEYEETPEILSEEDIIKTFTQIRYIYTEDIDNPENFVEVEDTFMFEAKDVIEIIFREKWLEHPKYGFQKQVLAFAPVVFNYDPKTGEKRGKMSLFWIKP